MAKRYGLGNFNKPVTIIFDTDKNGRRLAYRRHPGVFRKFRISMDLAEMIVAAEDAQSVWHGDPQTDPDARQIQ